ncbi:MAG TPA: alpha/beta fold hydrolase [Fredinandcohnia sp.]|nr:alpha/beta fold hydrolase [Fredinandcohnia sp.]
MTPEHEANIEREDGFTTVGGVRIHYEAYGAGEPVVLVHGLGASAVAWRRVAPHLAEAGYRVLALDLKGCGLSDRPPGDYSRKALASLVCGFMDNVGVHRARALVGHSMGGAIVLEIASARPHRTDLVGVVDGQGVVSPPWYLQAAAPVTPIVGTLASGMTALSPVASRRFFVRMYLRRIFGDPSAVTEELVDAYAAHADAGYQRAMFAMIQDMGNTEDLAERIRRMKIPAILVWGKEDPICPVSWGQALHRELPDSEFHVLEGCGHCTPEERPGALAALLVDFFARRGPRPTPDLLWDRVAGRPKRELLH